MPRKKPNSSKTTPPAVRKAADSAPASSKRAAISKYTLDLTTLAFNRGFWKTNLVPALILLILPFAIYGLTLGYDFVLDDKMVYSENKFVHEGTAGIKDILGKDTFTGYLGEQKDLVVGGRYRPLSLVTFALEYQIFSTKRTEKPKPMLPGEGGHQDMEYEISPAIGHFGNILLYALTGLLIFRLMMQLFPLKEGTKWYLSLPFWVALLYLVHPLHSEVVANIKGRDEILAMLLSLGAMYYSWRYLGTQKLLPMILSGVVFFLACLAKENALTFVAVIPLAAWFFVTRDPRVAGKVAIPLLAGAFLYLLIRYDVMGYFLSSGKEVTGLMNNPWVDATTGQKFATVFYTWLLYLKLLIFPHPLTHDYYPYQVPLIGFGDIRAILSVLVVFGLIGLAIWQMKKRTVLSFSILFFFLTFSIVSNFLFTVGTMMNERFMYISSLGFCLALVWLLMEKGPELAKGKEQMVKMAGIGLLGVFLIGFTFKTETRIPDWETGETLNEAAIHVSVNSARANNFYGVNLYNQGMATEDRATKKALFDQAVPYFEKALEIYPEYLDALRMKAGTYGQLYVIDKDLDKVLDVFYTCLQVRHVPYIDQFMEYLNRRGEDPVKMANFYHHAGYGTLYKKHHDAPNAIKYLEWGNKLAPQDRQILTDLARIYSDQSNWDQALNYSRQGFELYPNDVDLSNLLGNARQKVAERNGN
ncbi:MAG: DUF1736 domain-containing protein [Bacteroidia bacterium]|nr:DUF1736 domain-containing protein [Bacteroidia bacterium]